MDSSYLSALMCQTDRINASDKLAEESDMNIKRIGIDLAKQVFQIHGVVVKKRWCYANSSVELNCWIILKSCRPV